MTRHSVVNLFVSAVIAVVVLIAVTAAVNARISIPVPAYAPTITSAHDSIVSQVISTVPLSNPVVFGYNSVSGLTYVGYRGNNGRDELAMLSGTQIITSIALEPYFIQTLYGSSPIQFVADPTTGYVFVGNGQNLVLLSGTQFISPPVGSPARTFAIQANPVTGRIYVGDDHHVTVFSGTQVIKVLLTPFLTNIVINSVTGYVYVTQFSDPDASYYPNAITIISDTEIVTTVEVGGSNGWGTAVVNPVSGYVYVSDSSHNSVMVLSGTNIVTSIVAPPSILMEANPATGYIYISDIRLLSDGHVTNTITIISDTEVVGRLSVGVTDSVPTGLGVNPTSHHVYIAHGCCWGIGAFKEGTVTVLSGTQIVDVLKVGQSPRQPESFVVNTVNNLAYVGNDEGSVSVIAEVVVPRSLTSDVLFTPGDNIIVDFGQPVITTSLQFEISPTLPFTVTWSPMADRVAISHDPLAIGTRYTLHVLPGGQAASGLAVMEKRFDYLYLPIHLFLPLINR